MDIIYEPPGPVAQEFMNSNAFIRGILGPIGSGKSVSCCMEIVKRAFMQKPGLDGIRRTKWVAARNTYPELKSTTIETWCQWIRPELFGPVKFDTPITHKVKLAHDVELSMIFLAMDRPDDVRKLLSLEVTGIWLNEAREFPKAILDGASSRVGRYPSMMEGGCSWAGVLMDTNAMDEDHWWPTLSNNLDTEELSDLRMKLMSKGAIEPNQPLMEFFRQPSGRSPQAENLKNLRPGYYEFAQIGKSEDWIKVYVDGDYGSVADGKPVYPEFNPQLHVASKPLTADPNRPLILGWDFGCTPACSVCQITAGGQFRVLDEIVGSNTVLSSFVESDVRPILNTRYAGLKIISVIDPAGTERSQSVGTSCRDVLRSKGLNPSAAYSNAFNPRREAVVQYLNQLVGGEPAFLLSPTCKTLRLGMAGKYRFKRVVVPGEERYKDVPDKNMYSHICESLQYASMFTGRPFRPAQTRPPMTQKYKPASRAGY